MLSVWELAMVDGLMAPRHRGDPAGKGSGSSAGVRLAAWDSGTSLGVVGNLPSWGPSELERTPRRIQDAVDLGSEQRLTRGESDGRRRKASISQDS